MRQLHVIGFTSDHRGLILAVKRGADTGGFVLAIDDTLLSHLRHVPQPGGAATDAGRGAGTERGGGSGRLGDPAGSAGRSGLSPREIQARLRSGRTVEEVAYEAGVSPDWIDRFAGPVLAEQAAAVARAGETTLHTPGQEASDRPLEAAVRRNLTERGVALTAGEFAAAWSACHLVERSWLVRFRFRARGRDQLAEWTLDQSSGVLTARNQLAAELGVVAPGGPVAPDPGSRPEAPARRSRTAPSRAGADPARRTAPAREASTGRRKSTRPAADTSPSPAAAPSSPADQPSGPADQLPPPGPADQPSGPADQLTLPGSDGQPPLWEPPRPAEGDGTGADHLARTSAVVPQPGAPA